VEANSTGGQGSRRAVAPSDNDDDDAFPHIYIHTREHIYVYVYEIYTGRLLRQNFVRWRQMFSACSPFLGAFSTLRKEIIISFVMSVRPPEQLAFQWTEINEILYLWIFRKYVEKIRI
jgi:hypothetical protein